MLVLSSLVDIRWSRRRRSGIIMMDSTTILLLPPTSTTLRYGDDPINMDGGWRLDADGGCVGGVGVFSDDDAARRNDVVRDGGKRCLAFGDGESGENGGKNLGRIISSRAVARREDFLKMKTLDPDLRSAATISR